MLRPSEWPGREVADPTGTRYGRLDDVFVGQASGEPEFGIVTISREGASKRVAVPLHTASVRDDVIVLPFEPSRVIGAPAVQGEVESIPPESGRRVLDYFGMAGDAPTQPMPPVSPEAETVLSEEQLDIGTEVRAAERVRVRKQVVTEEVTVTVELRREELVIERERIPRDELGAAGAEPFQPREDVVIVLHAEEPVVGRRVVPVERIKLRKDMVVEQATVTEPVRRERAAFENSDTTDQERPT